LIALPADQTAAALEIVGRIRCRAALVLSTGLPAALCKELHQIARRHGVFLLGPNSLGFQRPQLKLNASALGPLAAAGPLGLVSQSGALTAAILDWARHNGVGFSAVVALGPNTAVDLPQVLDFLAHDGGTQSILVYMEGIRHARRFMSALRAAAYAKPVVVMKAGRQGAGTRAALTHSASIVGAATTCSTPRCAAPAWCGCGSSRSCSRPPSAWPRASGRWAGGWPSSPTAAAPACWRPTGPTRSGWTWPSWRRAAVRRWRRNCCRRACRWTASSTWVKRPTGEHYRAALEACVQDRNGRRRAADLFAQGRRRPRRPLRRRWPSASRRLGQAGAGLLDGRRHRARRRAGAGRAQLPSFRTPESAVDAFHSIASFYRNQQLLQQTPPPLSELATPDTEGARLLIEGVLAERRKVLTEMESKALLAAFHIPVTRTMLARSANEAMLIASQLGYPVALKIDSPDISHKSDVQGVVLNLVSQRRRCATPTTTCWKRCAARSPQARINGVTIQPMAGLKRGREVYIGLTTDDPFGPVITFGAGGTMIELVADRAMELPPLNQFLARRLIERSRVVDTTLGEWRGAPPPTSRRWSACCCACRKWSARCPSCARWTSTPSSSTTPARWRSTRASSSTMRRRRPGPTTTWPSCRTRRRTNANGP
jgi:acetyltransferase